MKIVQVNTVCGTGSTGKISAALYHLAQANNFIPYIAFGRGESNGITNTFKIGNIFDFGFHVLSNFIKGNSGFASKLVTRKFIKWLDHIQPDLIHLHNLHGFYLNIELLFDYIKTNNIPIVWTLHDCWPFTGQCAYFDYISCTKWQSQCHSCKIFRSDYPYSLFKDNSYNNFTKKKEIFQGVNNLYVVSPSKWLDNLVHFSFLKDYIHFVIPNGIDLDLFSPSSEGKIPHLILGVASVWSKRKGLDFFYSLATILGSHYKIVLIGVNKTQYTYIKKHYPHTITPIIRTNNQLELVKWYQKASVFVNPTLEDNFPTTNLEALACGTPVVTFNTGGSPESIDSTCGIVVEKGNVNALAEAIQEVVLSNLYTKEGCRNRALLYSDTICLSKYIDLYTSICFPQKEDSP